MTDPSLLTNWPDGKQRKFYARLFLGALAERLRAAIPDSIVKDDAGAATEPLLDIYPPGWNENEYQEGAKNWPRIFIQLQGEKLKFYLRWREAGSRKKTSESAKACVLAYLDSLPELDGLNRSRARNLLNGAGSSCAILSRPFAPPKSLEEAEARVMAFYNYISDEIIASNKV